MFKLMQIIRTVINPRASMQAYDKRMPDVHRASDCLRVSSNELGNSARNLSAKLLRKHRAELARQNFRR